MLLLNCCIQYVTVFVYLPKMFSIRLPLLINLFCQSRTERMSSSTASHPPGKSNNVYRYYTIK